MPEEIMSLTKAEVAEWLSKPDLPPIVRECLEIRQSLSKSSTAKYTAILNRQYDHRVVDTLMYHGASTGRWSARGIQPQNMPRGLFSDVDPCIELIKNRDIEGLEMFYGDIMGAVSTCIRGAITAPPGYDLICADFSSIEAIVLAWLAEEHKVLKAFKAGKDLYVVAAMAIYGKEYEDITKAERQIGKVATLALGYAGGIGAFQSMATVYGVNVDNDVAQGIVDQWRDGHRKIVNLWYNTEKAAIKAVKEGVAVKVGRTTWATVGDFLHCRLPSGRVLSYYKPSVDQTMAPWGEMRDTLFFWGTNSFTRTWCEMDTYSGKLVENAIQAIARDFMSEAMLRVEEAGYKIVMTVHDEIVAEAEEGEGSLEEFINVMSTLPEWGAGCPVKADGWRGKRFRK